MPYLWAFISQGFGYDFQLDVCDWRSWVARTLGIGMRIAGWGGFLLCIYRLVQLVPAERQSGH